MARTQRTLRSVKRDRLEDYRRRGIRPRYFPGEWALGDWLTRRSERRLRALARWRAQDRAAALEHEPEGCAYCASGEAMAHRREELERKGEAGGAGLAVVLTLAAVTAAAWLAVWAAAVLQHAARGIIGG